MALDLPGSLGHLVGAGDFDGDDAQDLLSLEYSSNSNIMQVVHLLPSGKVWDLGLEWTLFDNPTIDFVTLPPLVADVTGDGFADIIVDRQNSGVATGSPAGFLVRDGLGAANPVLWGVSPGGNVQDWALGERGGLAGKDFVAVHAGDDTTPATPHMRWWTFTGGGFSGGTPLTLIDTSEARQPVTARLAGNDFDDVAIVFGSPVTEVRIYETVGTGLSLSQQFPLPPAWTATETRLTVSDLDLDGDADLVLLGRSASGLELFPIVQLVNGTLQGFPMQSVSLGSSNATTLSSAVWFNPDQDTDMDLALGTDPLVILESVDGAAASVLLQSEIRSGEPLLLHDVDNDGFDDLVGGNWLIRGTGRLDGGVLHYGASALPISSARFYDWEDDGDLDLIGQMASVQVNNGAGEFSSARSSFPAAGGSNLFARTAAIDDFDGDQRIDYVVQFILLQPFPLPPIPLGMALIADDNTGGYIATGSATAVGIEIPDDTTKPWPTADVDGDGDLDITTDQGWWRNTGTGFFGSAVVNSWQGRPIVSGDFDNDGDDDVVVNSNGALNLFRFSGGGFLQTSLSSLAADGAAFAVDWSGDMVLDLVLIEPGFGAVRLFSWAGSQLQLNHTLSVPGVAAEIPLVERHPDGEAPSLFVQRTTLTGEHRLVGFFPLERAAGFGRGGEQLLPAPIKALADLDADGDDDALINGLIRVNLTYDGPLSGSRIQYGEGLAGDGGAVPVLGLGGPLRVGAGAPTTFQLRRAPGASFGFLAMGLNTTSFPFPTIPGLTLYVDPILVLLQFSTTGASAEPGSGQLTFTVTPDLSLVGVLRTMQAFVLDTNGPSGLAASNGLATIMGVE